MQKQSIYTRSLVSFDNEIWLPISKLVHPYIMPCYYVSNYGRIYNNTPYGGNFLRGSIDKEGYKIVTLHVSESLGDNKRNQITARVNRIVLLTFVPIGDPDKYVAHHINHIRYDNRLENLMWATSQENTQFSFECGYMRFVDVTGQNNPMSILTNDQVIEIKDKIRSKQYGLVEIANQYNISPNVIYTIIKNKGWKGIGGDITPEDIPVCKSLTDEEFESICRYFDTHDINNRDIYPSMQKLLLECYNSLGLNEKYGPMGDKRKLMQSILRKTTERHKRITSKYSYIYQY